MPKYLLVFAIFAAILTVIRSETGFRLDEYHDYDAMLQIMKDVNERCPEKTRLYKLPPVGIEEFDTSVYPLNVSGLTVEGRELWVLEFAKNPGKHTPGIPEFKYVANMHGNEVTGREHLLKLMDYMCESLLVPTDDSDDIRWLVENTRIHLMPSMNPDGFELAARLHRDAKGKKDWLKGRANGNNVDLNRNFPDLDKLMYKLEKNPHHANNHLVRLKQTLIEYADALEPETKAVMVWMAAIPFVSSANFHNGDLVANYPYDEAKNGKQHSYTASPDDKTFRELAKSYSEFHRWMSVPHLPCDKMGNDNFAENDGITNGADWYSVPGGMQDYNYLETNCFEITLELGCDKFPHPNMLPQLWWDNIDALFNFMFQVHTGIKGRIKSPRGVTLIANISVTDLDIPDGYIDHDILSTRYGDYFRLLANGNYKVTAAVAVKDENGQDEIITRTTCVSIYNDPRNYKEALRVDFDFTDLSKKEDTYGCKPKQSHKPLVKNQDGVYSGQNLDDYGDIVELLQQLYGKYRNRY